MMKMQRMMRAANNFSPLYKGMISPMTNFSVAQMSSANAAVKRADTFRVSESLLNSDSLFYFMCM